MSGNVAPTKKDGRPGLGITQSVVLGQRNATSMRCLVVGDDINGGKKKASEKWKWLDTFQSNLTYGSTDPDIPDVSDLAPNEKEAIDQFLSLDRPSSEAERMRKLLEDLARGFAKFKSLGTIGEDEVEEQDVGGKDGDDESRISELLLTLRDVVGERIDPAKAFVAIGGLALLLGGAAERILVPRNVRSTCLRVLADLVNINRAVQYSLLDNGGIRYLAMMYFNEFSDNNGHESSDGKIRGRVVQTMDAAVTGHPGAERLFCESPEARKVIESGLGVHSADEVMTAGPPAALRRQCLKFLADLLGPAAAAHCRNYGTRVSGFNAALNYIAASMLDEETEPDWECRELAIKILRYVLKSSSAEAKDVVVPLKETIGSTGVKRLTKMRGLNRQESNASETEQVDKEMYLWKQLTEELEKLA